MAYKSKYIDLKSKNIQYLKDNEIFTLQSYNQLNMTVQVLSLTNQTTVELPFAHLPKKIKKQVNPK